MSVAGGVEALVFDVFGTLVDWRTSLIDDLTAFGDERGLRVDWAALVDAWRGAYVPSMDRVRRGELPWMTIDALHRASFDELAQRFGIAAALDEDARRWCVDRWHRLRPWPDTVPGLTRLRTRYILGTLSNGNVRLLTDMAKYAALPFDVILSAELFRHYKTDPEVYLGAVELLATTPERVMLVAAHNADLHAAARVGMRTAFVARPTEYGPAQDHDFTADAGFDFAVGDLGELADRLGA
jgi:2-haloacid dehalogenase